MKRTLLVALCVILGLFSGTALATEATVFGPEQYVRTNGAPNVYTDTFTGLFTENVNTGKLTVLNGNQAVSCTIRQAEY